MDEKFFMEAMEAVGIKPIIFDENGPKVDETKLMPDQELSPFLDGTNIQFAWDSTSLDWLKRCPRLYQYAMIEGWRPNEESIHLRFGIEYHQSLQDYDISRAAGIGHDEAVHDVVRELFLRTADWDPDHKYKNRDNLVRTVIWNFEQFKDDPAKTVILDNGKPACEVSFRFELDWGPKSPSDPALTAQPYLLTGHLDKIVNFHDELFVKDYKTTTIAPSAYYFNQFEPNNQMSLYTLAGQVVLNAPIKGVIIEAAEIKVDFSRFVRGFTYRTADQLDEWVGDLRYHLENAERYAKMHYWPQNDTACDKYGGCAFRQVCSKSPSARRAFLESDFTQEEKWNPLKSR